MLSEYFSIHGYTGSVDNILDFYGSIITNTNIQEGFRLGSDDKREVQLLNATEDLFELFMRLNPAPSNASPLDETITISENPYYSSTTYTRG